MSTVETKATLEAENAKLLSRVAELESELGKSKKMERTKEKLDDAVEEGNRLLNAMAHAFVEELRSTADVLKTVADEAFKRHEARVARLKEDRLKEEKAGFSFSEIEEDVLAVVNKGIEKSLAAPQRVVDKFHAVYHERAHA
jgi:hypothetical protein